MAKNKVAPFFRTRCSGRGLQMIDWNCCGLCANNRNTPDNVNGSDGTVFNHCDRVVVTRFIWWMPNSVERLLTLTQAKHGLWVGPCPVPELLALFLSSARVLEYLNNNNMLIYVPIYHWASFIPGVNFACYNLAWWGFIKHFWLNFDSLQTGTCCTTNLNEEFGIR